MPARVNNADVEKCLREILAGEGYSLSPPRTYGQTGVDIVAKRGADTIHVETIGNRTFEEKTVPPNR